MKENYRNRSRDEAVEIIECYININKLAPLSKLPSERDMSEMWNFNRVTLRSAIHRLVVEGRLYQKRGSGTYVAQPRFIRNLPDLKSLSKLAEENKQTLTSRVLSVDVIESSKQITQRLHLPLGHKVYALTRLRSIDGEPVIIENAFLNYNRFLSFTEHDFAKESLYSVIENDYKIQIVRGEEKIGIAYATDYEAKLLEIEAGEAVFYITGVAYDEHEKPVEYVKSITRADKIRFASVLKDREERDI